MTPFQCQRVAAVFDGYPDKPRKKLLKLREIIFEVAATMPNVGALQETLKWGEPAYVTAESKSGSTIRIAWKKARPNHYAMYFICTTNLVETFRTLFPQDFEYEGNRAIIFSVDDALPKDSVRFCIGAALTHRLKKGGVGV
jgi:Domain of unknown function (DU1801)